MPVSTGYQQQPETLNLCPTESFSPPPPPRASAAAAVDSYGLVLGHDPVGGRRDLSRGGGGAGVMSTEGRNAGRTMG